ncbi:para-aminobenzoate synthase [Cryphonectria parasitica EP155]|uniref:aminodeoxychorismate synthase n=1 Tax=Cryphonectria parasitica (strain ATCC 38755 / EP155) TaxID=660469 RepID=A0A9P5CVC7_CRYP1|nr:para-aminobenzoate synthase [Cryphonectria parasitica EP155]KAF3771021.1 para-aminobenzoate synthase [Cryphonectria parasitica EP155]
MGSTDGPLFMSSTRPRILFIDAYDSFSNNITSLLTSLLHVDVYVLSIDAPISKEQLSHEVGHYEAVVCGPGPGSPGNEADAGLMQLVWELDEDSICPVLGVCLGFQSLVLACGGKIRRLKRGLHGLVRTIQHQPTCSSATRGDDVADIFKGLGDFKATLYHSLCADVGQDSIIDWEGTKKWESPVGQPDIVPLAWVEEDRCDAAGGPERILMALKHRRKPFWGLQYHPESVCTEEEGHKVIRNWFDQARRWNMARGRVVNTDLRDTLARNAVRMSLHQQAADSMHLDPEGRGVRIWRKLMHSNTPQTFQSRCFSLPKGIEAPHIAEILDSHRAKSNIIFDSANSNQPAPKIGVDVRGRFSIMAVDVDESMRIEHHTTDNFVTLVNGVLPASREAITLAPGKTVWHFLAEIHEARRTRFEMDNRPHEVPDENDVPFLGGFVGFVTYEQGLSDIDIKLPRDRGHRRPDVCLAWVKKSIVLDHQKGVVHVQHLESDFSWIDSTAQKLQSSETWRYGHQDDDDEKRSSCRDFHKKTHTVINKPDPAKYEAKVRMCQEYIAAGDSYELCLTDQTRITRTKMTGSSPAESCWQLYRTLRRRNPAPFASYIRLGGATLVSSSPERFLQYDRSGLCSMKPMKGTVKKSTEPGSAGCATTLAEAEAILHVPKEEAENLMIVDLVRHDLHGICGAGKVTVPELLKVEEYQTVYTMITRVEGQLPRGPGASYSGLDVLSASLPPGSMTGAPKKRSCEILQQVEGGGKERSLYSGVVGYMCVTGRGDWSVTIRSMFRWDDESTSVVVRDDGEEKKEVWHIGAGGAVTILSTPEGEREEMFVKLARPLSIFTEEEGGGGGLKLEF